MTSRKLATPQTFEVVPEKKLSNSQDVKVYYIGTEVFRMEKERKKIGETPQGLPIYDTVATKQTPPIFVVADEVIHPPEIGEYIVLPSHMARKLIKTSITWIKRGDEAVSVSAWTLDARQAKLVKEAHDNGEEVPRTVDDIIARAEEEARATAIHGLSDEELLELMSQRNLTPTDDSKTTSKSGNSSKSTKSNKDK